MALNSVLRRRCQWHHLDRCPVLLHGRGAAVLRRQRPVIELSDLVALSDSGWAIELTRHRRSKRATLLCGSSLEDPIPASVSHFLFTYPVQVCR
jgi:hypothetical protein